MRSGQLAGIEPAIAVAIEGAQLVGEHGRQLAGAEETVAVAIEAADQALPAGVLALRVLHAVGELAQCAGGLPALPGLELTIVIAIEVMQQEPAKLFAVLACAWRRRGLGVWVDGKAVVRVGGSAEQDDQEEAGELHGRQDPARGAEVKGRDG